MYLVSMKDELQVIDMTTWQNVGVGKIYKGTIEKVILGQDKDPSKAVKPYIIVRISPCVSGILPLEVKYL